MLAVEAVKAFVWGLSFTVGAAVAGGAAAWTTCRFGLWRKPTERRPDVAAEIERINHSSQMTQAQKDELIAKILRNL